MILDVPYVSQVGNQYRNDCGESASSMIAGYAGKVISINDMQQAMGRTNQTDTLAQLQGGLKKFGIETEIYAPCNLADLATFVSQGKPPICLVNYGKIPKYAKVSTYTGGHYVVVIGVDTKVHYHDPLNRADVTITKQEFVDAFQSQCLINKVGYLPVIPLPPEEVLDMTAEEYRKVQTHLEFIKAFKFAKGIFLRNDNGTFIEVDANGKTIRAFGTPDQLHAAGWEFGDEN